MIVFTEEDKKFIRKNLQNAEEVLQMEEINDVLDTIGDWIDDNGFAPPDYYDYNDKGREAQKVYDRIFLNNQIPPIRKSEWYFYTHFKVN